MGFLDGASWLCDRADCRVCPPYIEEIVLGKRKATPSELRAMTRLWEKREAATIMADDPTTEVHHITQYEDLVDVLPEMIEAYRNAHSAATVAEKTKKELQPQIMGLLEAVGQKSLRGDHWQVTRCGSGKNPDVISAELLLAEGVAMDVIERCTVKGKDKADHIRVTSL